MSVFGRLFHLAIVAVLLAFATSVAGCGAQKGAVVIFKTAEDARAHVKATKITGDRFELSISNDMTIDGKPDPIGLGMALVLDAILAQGYQPDGFEQRDGYRVYKYKPFK